MAWRYSSSERYDLVGCGGTVPKMPLLPVDEVELDDAKEKPAEWEVMIGDGKATELDAGVDDDGADGDAAVKDAAN